ncbi:alpha/beta hydrolase [Shewanella maritima]|uniref:alpha/beta hydrolase n=1 Tax=Shewanella maritima TaxID=2520507 RepID=UPI00373670E3
MTNDNDETTSTHSPFTTKKMVKAAMFNPVVLLGTVMALLLAGGTLFSAHVHAISKAQQGEQDIQSSPMANELLKVPMPNVSQGQIQRLNSADIDFAGITRRPIDVWLPEDYPAKAPYAVVYMHDGQMLYDAEQSWNKTSWEMDEASAKLNQSGEVKPFIVVGVHNAGPSRHSEYFPQKPFESLTANIQAELYKDKRSESEDLFHQRIYSDKYAAFLAKSLKPYIDSQFEVASDKSNTFVMGSSMGGLISWYTALEYPTVFGGAACLSTHWPGAFFSENNPIPEAFNNYLVKKLSTNPQVKLYFDYGDQTLDAMYPPLQKQVDAIFRASYPTTLWQSHFYKGEAHTEKAWAKRVAVPLSFLLKKPESD